MCHETTRHGVLKGGTSHDDAGIVMQLIKTKLGLRVVFPQTLFRYIVRVSNCINIQRIVIVVRITSRKAFYLYNGPPQGKCTSVNYSAILMHYKSYIIAVLSRL